MEKQVQERENNNRNRIVLLILGVATVLIALIGATFAYFTSVINSPKGNQSITVTTTEVQGVTYTASDPLTLVDALPGDHSQTTFSISNPNSTASVKYGLKLVVDVDNFVNTEGNNQLVVTISGGQLTGNMTFDLTDGASVVGTSKSIADDITLAAGSNDQYTVRVDFFDTQDVQNTNQKKSFAGHIEVTQSIITTSGN